MTTPHHIRSALRTTPRRNSKRCATGIITALVLLIAAPAGAVELGRLFFTPRERQELDRRRLSKEVESAPTPLVEQSSITLNGHVSRSSGKTTTWINGVPQYDAYKPREADRVLLEDGALKIGETRDRARGEVSNTLRGGEVRVHRTPPR